MIRTTDGKIVMTEAEMGSRKLRGWANSDIRKKRIKRLEMETVGKIQDFIETYPVVEEGYDDL